MTPSDNQTPWDKKKQAEDRVEFAEGIFEKLRERAARYREETKIIVVLVTLCGCKQQWKGPVFEDKYRPILIPLPRPLSLATFKSEPDISDMIKVRVFRFLEAKINSQKKSEIRIYQEQL